MNDEKRNISIQILNKTYHVECAVDEIPILQEAALYLDDKINECSYRQHKPNQSRLLIMAALNITHELISAKNQNKEYVKNMGERIKELQNRIDETVKRQQEIDLT